MTIKIATTTEELTSCFPVLQALRPHLSLESFLQAVLRMQQTNNYQVAYLEDNQQIKAVAGFRIAEWLHTGLYLEIEELITDETARSQGLGGQLFDWLTDYARSQQCRQLRLVSGVKREDAHRFYLNKGMQYEAKYFSLNL